MKTDKQRIVALQKALRIAKGALERIAPYYRDSSVEDALYEINKLDWNSKPDLVQGLQQPATPTKRRA